MTRDMIVNMVELQNNTNIQTIGEDWVNTKTHNGKEVNWNRCMLVEAVECIDSFSWKHWKNGVDDIDNAKMEIVDIVHFLISELLSIHDKEDVINILHTVFTIDTSNNNFINNNSTVFLLEEFIAILFTRSRSKKDSITLTEALSTIMDSLDFTIEVLHELYIIKNVLNKFRQNNGYKEGTYVKVISGKEDNVHITNLYEEGDSFKILYDKYDHFYNDSVL